MSPLSLGAWLVVCKRAAHDRVVVAAAFLTTLLATTLLASGPVYADAVALSGLQRTLANAPVSEVTVAVSDHLGAPDYDAADGRVTQAVESAFGREGATIHRSGLSDSFALPALPGVPADGLTLFGYYDDLAGHAELVDGTWPAGSRANGAEAAISEGAADALGLEAGDTLEVTSVVEDDVRVPVHVSGIYRVEDVEDVLGGEPARAQRTGVDQVDSANALKIMELVRELVASERVSAIVATHDSLLLDVADVVELRDGRLAA